jgi:hypothetical protein
MTKNLSQRLDDELAELRELGDLGSDGCSARILRAHSGSRSRLRCSDRQALDLLVARPHRERIERGADAHHHADRPAGDLRGERQSVGARLVHGLHQAPPALGSS